ncbi:MAG: FeoA family protein [Peptoniphilaceae bacterium]|nr:ferrous iron transport protein A [Peptoniphilaceae bacterium]MDD7382771.1 FeoA family protein [Peptoniphilaceae bacterium]MDY3737927.1 FeoA family protein [Peptoniphilaceae bacterium]
MPLTILNIGQTAIIQRISGKDDIRRHLSNIGFVEGKKISLFSFDGTNYIIEVDSSRIALNKDLAKRIYVREDL